MKELTPCFGFVFNVRGMEIIKHRNKQRDPCFDYNDEDAIKVLHDVTTTLGCKPKYWELPSLLPECSQKQLSVNSKLIDDGLYNSNAKRLVKPCRSIRDIWYDYDLYTSVDSCNTAIKTLHIVVNYNDLHFKEISYVAAYSIWDLVGNLSLILGLLLGFSILQLPDLVLRLIKRYKRFITGTHHNDTDVENNTLDTRMDVMETDIAHNRYLISLLFNPIISRRLAQSLETSV